MAISLTLQTGPHKAVQTAVDEAKAQEVIRRFALATGADPEATNQQLLNHAVAELAMYMVRRARKQKIAEAETVALEDAESNVVF